MNTKEFVQVLRKIIKEEVKSAVKEAIKEQSSNSLMESLNNDLPDYDFKHKKKQVKQVVNKQFTKDPLLNSLLNETAASGVSIPTENTHNDYSDWPTLKMNSYADLMGNTKFTQKIDATPDGVPATAVPEEVKTALTRDYRSLMKAIDKKKGK